MQWAHLHRPLQVRCRHSYYSTVSPLFRQNGTYFSCCRRSWRPRCAHSKYHVSHLRPFWKSFTEILNGEQFSNALLGKFHTLVQDRFKSEVGKVRFTNDILLVRDHSKYYLPPHSDAPHRVLVLVIYLPETREHPELGTSVYIPKDPSFHCRGGPTHEFDQFNRVYTAPYLPNSAFGFFKTTNSFHGVEPLANKKLSRDLIHFFIRH